MISVIAIGLLVIAIVFGAWKGLAFQLAGIASLILGFVVAVPLSPAVAPLFGTTAPLNRFVAMLVLYALTSLAIYGVAIVYRQVLEGLSLAEWDRHLGAVFGGIQGWLIIVVVALFASALSPKARETVLPTPVGRYAARTIDLAHKVLPPEVHEFVHPYVHSVESIRTSAVSSR